MEAYDINKQAIYVAPKSKTESRAHYAPEPARSNTRRQTQTHTHTHTPPIQSHSSMHHYECVALCKNISLQKGRFCTRSLASCIPRSSEDRSSRMFFIPVVRGHRGGRLQFSAVGSKIAWLASAFSYIRARCPKKVMDESGGLLVMAFLTKSCQRMSRILRRQTTERR